MKKILFLPSLTIAFTVQIVMMYISWKHNSQCEIHCSEPVNNGYTLINGIYVDFDYWFLIGFSWFIPTFIIIFLLTFIIDKITKMR